MGSVVMTCGFPQKSAGANAPKNGRLPKKAAIIHKIPAFVGTTARLCKMICCKDPLLLSGLQANYAQLSVVASGCFHVYENQKEYFLREIATFSYLR